MNEIGLISVIIPVYNGEAFVAEAIESVLAQEYAPLEIIVVDDGSTDQTAAIVQALPVQYHHQANRGSSIARNHGIALATGAWLAFLDADDLWSADKLAKQTAAITTDPALDLVWGHVVEFKGSRANRLGDSLPGHHPGTMLIRAESFARVGRFSEQFQKAEVVEWMTRALQAGVTSLMLPDTLMYRRIHATNKGNTAENKREYLQALKQHLDRQRANQK